MAPLLKRGLFYKLPREKTTFRIFIFKLQLGLLLLNMKKYAIGEFEEIVMLTVAVLFDEAYGVAIKEEIERRLKRKVSVGAMRTALSRLEKKGFLDSEFGEPTAVRGGKRKRYFKVTVYGRKALASVMSTRKQLWDDIPAMAFEYAGA